MQRKTGRRCTRVTIGYAIVLGLLIIISLVPRLANLDRPILEKNAFRQTQTALTAQVFSNSGIDFLWYETPLFGPPWMVPFEFPLYQATVAAVAWLAPEEASLDISCRLAAVVFFYLSAVALLLVCCEVLEIRTCVWIAAVYLLMPFNLVYSRMSLVDYTSVTFVLFYLLAVMKWFRSDRRKLWSMVAICSGSVAATVKVTTIPVILPAVLLMFAWHVFLEKSLDDRGSNSVFRRLSAPGLAQLVAMTVIPVMIEGLWLWHTDQIKSSSPFTLWLTSENLQHWTWGTISQRLGLRNWLDIGSRVERLMMPGAMALLPLLAFFSLRMTDSRYRLFVLSMALGCACPVLLFFHLYVVHEYYLIAVAPPAAVLVGVGLSTLTRRGPLVVLPIQIAAVIFMLIGLYRAYSSEVGPMLKSSWQPSRDIAVAEMIRSATAPCDAIAMTQANSNWDSTIPYYSDRRFLILRNTVEDPRVDDFLVANGFRYGVFHASNPLRLVRWQKTLLGSAAEYRLFELNIREEPDPPLNGTAIESGESILLLSSATPGLAERLVPVQQIRISATPQGISIDATGYDPFLLLPHLEIPPGHRVSIRIVIDAPSATELKVYFTTPSSPKYTEELRVRETLQEGENNLIIQLSHPEVRGALRLDPGTVPGRYVLRFLEVRADPISSW